MAFVFFLPQGTESMEAYSPNLTKFWHMPRTCPGGSGQRNPFDPNSVISEYNETGLDVPPEMFDYSGGGEGDSDSDRDRRRNNIIAGAARSKVSRSSESSLGLSSSNRLTLTACLYAAVLANSLVVSIFIRL